MTYFAFGAGVVVGVMLGALIFGALTALGDGDRVAEREFDAISGSAGE